MSAEPGIAGGPASGRDWVWVRRRLEPVAAGPRPLFRPAPRSIMFFPLVVLAAVLPGLYALNWWDLIPPGPWWGLRGLAVLDGWWLDQVAAGRNGLASEAAAYRAVALQPPLYAWLEALWLRLSPSLNPLATVLPSYAAGVLVIVLVFLLGRAWRGPGLGLVAAVLTAFNRDLLVQMQQASPATLAVAGVLGAILAYGRFLRAEDGRGRAWAGSGGACLGLSLLAVGLFGLLCLPIVAVHQAAMAREPAEHRSWRRGGAAWMGGILALAVASAIALPWYGWMLSRYGAELARLLVAPPRTGWGAGRGVLGTVPGLAPASWPLAVLGLVQAAGELRRSVADERARLGGSLWLGWLGVAATAVAGWRAGPQATLNLLLLVPLNVLAAGAMVDLAQRRVGARALIWLAPATAVSLAWWLSGDLRAGAAELMRGHWPRRVALLGPPIFAGLVLLATRRLDGWARRDDRRRRILLGVFLGGVLAVTAGAGLREVRFRHVETAELLELRAEILGRQRLRPLTLLAVVGPEGGAGAADRPPPGGRLRFVLRTALPDLAQLDYKAPEELRDLPNPPGAQRLVILVGTDQGLPYRLQSQLGLEMIHAGRTGVLDAFATTYVPPRRRR